MHLEELMISGNPIGQRGALAIADAIQKNTRLAGSLQYRNIGFLSSNTSMRAQHNFEFFPVEQHHSHLDLTSNIDDATPSPVPKSTQPVIVDKGPRLEKDEEIFYRGLYARFLAECSSGDCSWPSCRLLKRTGLVASENSPINEESCAALSQRMATVFEVHKSATNNGADAFIAFMQDSPLGIIARAVHRAIKKMSKQDPFRPPDSDAWLPPEVPLSAQEPTAPELDLDAPLTQRVNEASPISSSVPQAFPGGGENGLNGPATSAIKQEEEMGRTWSGFWNRLL